MSLWLAPVELFRAADVAMARADSPIRRQRQFSRSRPERQRNSTPVGLSHESGAENAKAGRKPLSAQDRSSNSLPTAPTLPGPGTSWGGQFSNYPPRTRRPRSLQRPSVVTRRWARCTRACNDIKRNVHWQLRQVVASLQSLHATTFEAGATMQRRNDRRTIKATRNGEQAHGTRGSTLRHGQQSGRGRRLPARGVPVRAETSVPERQLAQMVTSGIHRFPKCAASGKRQTTLTR
jgi:hypothetical protein